jgi:hypothetical protein
VEPYRCVTSRAGVDNLERQLCVFDENVSRTRTFVSGSRGLYVVRLGIGTRIVSVRLWSVRVPVVFPNEWWSNLKVSACM